MSSVGSFMRPKSSLRATAPPSWSSIF